MISINLTLIAQIFHFCVAYFLIRFLFLKPLLETIEQEDSHNRELKKNVTDAERVKTAHELSNADLWAQAQRGFAKVRPETESAQLTSDVAFEVPLMTPTEIKQEETKLAHDILASWERNGA